MDIKALESVYQQIEEIERAKRDTDRQLSIESQRNDNLMKELETERNASNKLKDKIISMQEEHAMVQRKLDLAEQTISKKDAQIQTHQEELSAIQRDVARQREEYTVARKTFSEELHRINMEYTSYVMGDASPKEETEACSDAE